jgi:hypothetical protein
LTDAARFGFKTGERRRFVMPIPLRADFDATQVRALARTSEDARQVRRLLALAAIYDGASRWDEFQVSIAKQTLSRELRAMGYRKLSARPRHHAQAEGAIEALKKTSPPSWMRSHARTIPVSAT